MNSIRTLITAGAVALAAAGITALPASADTLKYVALGDSYSAGNGTKQYFDDGTACYRSPLAFPALLAKSLHADLDFQACSGAKTADVLKKQVSALGADTDLVTMTVGGNDAGFMAVLTECAKIGWMSDCNGALDKAQALTENKLPGRLDKLYTEIANRAPNAKVIVLGYPRLFMGKDCNVTTFFSPAEEKRINSMADKLRGIIGAAAKRHGFTYVNPIPAFVDHAVCDDPEWLNGMVLRKPTIESYHPNKLGHARGYLPLVKKAVNATAVGHPK